MGNAVTPCIYKYASSFVEKRAHISTTEDAYGYIDLGGKEVIPQICKSGSDFWGGAALVRKDKNKYFLIDTSGKQIPSSPFWAKIEQIEYDQEGKEIHYYSYRALSVSKIVKGVSKKEIKNTDGKIKEVLISLSGEQIESTVYDKIDLDYFNTNPYIKVYLADSSSYGLINASGKNILPIRRAKYENEFITDFTDGYAISTYIVINMEGKDIMTFDSGRIVNRSKKYLIVHYAYTDDYHYKIFDIEKQQFQKTKYYRISKIVNDRILAVDSSSYNYKPTSIYRINVATQQKEDSLLGSEFNDISAKDHRYGDYLDGFYTIPFWDRIEFVLMVDTSTAYSYNIINYNFQKKGSIFNAREQDMEQVIYDQAGNEKIERTVYLESTSPILKEVFVTQSDTLIRINCSKPTTNNKGQYLVTSDRNYLMNYYDVLVDLHGVIRYEVIFGNNLIDTIITRDRNSQIIDKFSFAHPEGTFCVDALITYLPQDKLFHSFIQTGEQVSGGHLVNRNSNSESFFTGLI